MSVLISARQRTGPTVHAGLTDSVAACAAPAIVSAASAPAHAETLHTLNRIPRLPSEIRPPEYPRSVAGKRGTGRPTRSQRMAPTTIATHGAQHDRNAGVRAR